MVTHWRTWTPLSEHSANIERRTSFCEQYNKLFLTLIIDQYYCTVIWLHINFRFNEHGIESWLPVTMLPFLCWYRKHNTFLEWATLLVWYLVSRYLVSAIGNNFYCRSSTFSRTLLSLRTLKTWKFLKMLEDIMIREFIPDYYYDDWLLSTVNYKRYWQ